MIKLQQLITEGRYDYGCVMARLDEETTNKILDFNGRFIGEDILYTEEENHGREKTPHVTIKYGLTQSYNQDQIREILGNTRPFTMEIRGISLFENEKFDVVKFDVDGADLRRLNEIFSKLPNEDKYPTYNPHMTLAYVQKGQGRGFVRNPKRISRVPITMLEYSDNGLKSYYNL